MFLFLLNYHIKFLPHSINDNYDQTCKNINETQFKDKVKYGKNVLLGKNVSIDINCFIGHNTIIEKMFQLEKIAQLDLTQ